MKALNFVFSFVFLTAMELSKGNLRLIKLKRNGNINRNKVLSIASIRILGQPGQYQDNSPYLISSSTQSSQSQGQIIQRPIKSAKIQKQQSSLILQAQSILKQNNNYLHTPGTKIAFTTLGELCNPGGTKSVKILSLIFF